MMIQRTDVLRAILKPFARVDLPDGGDGEDVWLYVGKADPNGSNPPHLKLEDFQRARRCAPWSD